MHYFKPNGTSILRQRVAVSPQHDRTLTTSVFPLPQTLTQKDYRLIPGHQIASPQQQSSLTARPCQQ